MRLHCSKAHRKEYNEELIIESKKARKNWTIDEVNFLAECEANSMIKNPTEIIDMLVTKSARSRDAIKKRRNTAEYKLKVIEYTTLLKNQPNSTFLNATTIPLTSTTISENQNITISNSNIEIPELEASININITPPNVLNNENTVSAPTNNNSIALGTMDNLDTSLINTIVNINSDKLDESDKIMQQAFQLKEPDLTNKFEKWCEALLNGFSKSPTGNNNRENSIEHLIKKMNTPGLSNRKKRAISYRLIQGMYLKDKAATAEIIIDGKNWEKPEEQPSAENILAHYKEIFSTESPLDEIPIADKIQSIHVISSPITENEIINCINKTKSNAAGPDGITLKNFKKIPTAKLLLLYNGMLLLEILPNTMKKNKTILIPKSEKELLLINNWRPITMSSIVLRIVHKIMANKLSQIKINSAQRGFSKIDGCFANCITVQTIIKSFRKSGSPVTMLSLDLRKAFDIVSHHSIIKALNRFHCDQKLINYIRNSYLNTTTEIQCNKKIAGSVKINRGVKQGDPLSPILFNLTIDELITKLEKFSGVRIGNTYFRSLAYADDLILFAKTPEDANRMLQFCDKFFMERGMSLNISKCRPITMKTVPSKKKLYIDNKIKFNVRDEYIMSLGIEGMFDYLGQQISCEGIKIDRADEKSAGKGDPVELDSSLAM